LKSGTDIVPVVLTYDPPMLMKGQKWYHVPARTPQVTLRVEEPIASKEFLDRQTSMALAARRLTAACRAMYEKALRQAGSCGSAGGDPSTQH
jgi:hypothetical protein